ncbi:hypothetical protein ES703_23538 [subsurface metagenome]
MNESTFCAIVAIIELAVKGLENEDQQINHYGRSPA